MKMDLSRIFTQNQKIVYREEDDGAFLFDPDTGDLRYMNHTGKEAFALLMGDKDFEQIIDHLLQLYPEVERSRMQTDVEVFLMDLEQRHIILPSNSQ